MENDFKSWWTKQAQGVIFSRKTKKLLRPFLLFNSIPLKNFISQKRLALTLDVKLTSLSTENITLKISNNGPNASISTNPTKIIPTDYVQIIH